MWPSAVAAGTIVAVSLALLWWHARVWREGEAFAADEREHGFLFRQYRRRMQTSAMLGIVGVMIFAGHWVEAPLAALLYWLAVVVVVLWIMLLAGADMLATKMHYSQIETEHNVKTFKLKAALDEESRKQATKRRGRRGGGGLEDGPRH